MLQSFRDNLKGVVAFILVGIIIVPLAFFGIDALFITGSAVEEVAEVNGEPITELRLQQMTQIQRQQLAERFGDIDPDFLTDEQLRAPALNTLIRQTALSQAARERGMAVADATFSQLVTDNEAFREDGKFSRDMYEFSLRRMGYTPKTYREVVTSDLLVSQLASGIGQSGFVTQAMLEELAAVTRQKRDFYYLTVPRAPFLDEVSITDEDIVQYYQDNPQRFEVPERVVLEYIKVNPELLAATVEVDPAAVREQYQAELSSLEGGTQWRVAHILVEEAPDGSHRDTVAEIRQKLDAGEEFADLARQYSQDPGSAAQGGDLGTFTPGTLPPSFEAVLPELAEGEVSGPVETDSGIHLIRLVERTKTQAPTFDEARERIRRELALEQALERLPAVVEAVKEQSYTAESLETVGESLGLEVGISEPIGRQGGGEGIAGMPQVVRAAFSEEVLESGYASEVMEVTDNRYVVVKVRERLPAHQKPLDAVRDQIAATLRQRRASEATRDRAEALLARVKTGESVEAVAKSEGLEWQVSLETERFAAQGDPRLVEAVFSHPLKASLPVRGLVRGEDGDYRVYALTDIESGDLQQLPAQQRAAMRQSISGLMVEREWRAYQQALVERAEVVTADGQ